MSSQPIIISHGTFIQREETADSLIREIFGDASEYTSHMDFKLYELADDKKSISIEQIREIIREINVKPRISRKKVIWIKEAQNLSIEAQNAMLKSLEEPPDYARIILTANHHANLIETVVSRCIIKNLNLSESVDLSSPEYEAAKSEFLNLLSMDIGGKIDWVSENKTEIKDREYILNLLDMWEAVLREKMLESLTENTEANEYMAKIKLLQKAKRYIESNANASLAIEALLLNL